MTYIPLKRFCLLAHIRNYRFCCRMPRQDPTQTTSQTRTYLIGPLCAAERYPGRNRTAIALHTIWHDKHLCSHVCQRNRNYLEFRIVFTFMAVGMAVSRMFSGKQVDKGRITQVITLGLYLVCSCFFILSACGLLMKTVPELTTYCFYGCPPIGSRLRDDVPRLQYAVRKPGPQQPARNSHLYLPDFMGCRHWYRSDSRRLYRTDYLIRYGIFFGACLTVISIFYFNLKVSPHYHKNKLR